MKALGNMEISPDYGHLFDYFLDLIFMYHCSPPGETRKIFNDLISRVLAQEAYIISRKLYTTITEV